MEKEIFEDAEGLRFEDGNGAVWELTKFAECGSYPAGYDVVKVGARGKKLKETPRNTDHWKLSEMHAALKNGWIEIN